jgi:endonuclease/exonuclease/phosphatase family metal-dependent hydrolase
MRLKVLTLNVWNTEGDPRRTGLINRELRRLAPDLVALQEVVRTPKRDQLAELLDGLDLQVTHQADIQAEPPPFADRYGGAAIATQRPHRLVEVLDQRVADAPDTPWATLAARVDLGALGELLFIGTTGAWRPAAAAARERQARALDDLAARHGQGLPTILAGDFNAGPEDSSLRYLTGRQALGGHSTFWNDAWEIAGEGPGYTWTCENPNAAAGARQIFGRSGVQRRFDYLLVSPPNPKAKATIEVVSVQRVFDRPVDGVWLSDHCGVMAEIGVSAMPARPPAGETA